MKFLVTFLVILQLVVPYLGKSQTQYYVYSVSGNVTKFENNKFKQLSPLDRLNDVDKIKFSGKSSISIVEVKNKKVYKFSKNGQIVLRDLIKEQGSEISTTKKIFEYVINNFVEKGKLFHGEYNYSSTGMATRGIAKSTRVIAFPPPGTVIYKSRTFPVILDSSLVTIDNSFNIIISQNGEKLFDTMIVSAQIITLPETLNPNMPIQLIYKWRKYHNMIDIYFITDTEKLHLDKDILEIESDSVTFKNDSDKILAKAIYLESKFCYIDAIILYELLERKYNRKNELLALQQKLGVKM